MVGGTGRGRRRRWRKGPLVSRSDIHPDPRDLRREYTQRPFSVFAVSRQVKLPGERVCYSTIHSAMIFPVKGKARLSLDGEGMLGEWGVVLHGCPHRHLEFETLDDEPFVHLNVYYEAGECVTADLCAAMPDGGPHEASPNDWMSRPYVFVPADYEELLARVEALEALGKSPSLANRLNQIIGATALLKSMFDTSSRRRTDERMARVRAYLETRYAEPVGISDLAELVGMSEQRLSFCFNRAYGMRPMSFLIAQRLERAAQLLESDMLVKDVARAVGYEDPLYFSRLFKKHYGCSPSAMRRRREKGDQRHAPDSTR